MSKKISLKLEMFTGEGAPVMPAPKSPSDASRRKLNASGSDQSVHEMVARPPTVSIERISVERRSDVSVRAGSATGN